jgi:hypothetical protein
MTLHRLFLVGYGILVLVYHRLAGLHLESLYAIKYGILYIILHSRAFNREMSIFLTVEQIGSITATATVDS